MLTIPQLAEHYGVSIRTVYRKLKEGAICREAVRNTADVPMEVNSNELFLRLIESQNKLIENQNKLLEAIFELQKEIKEIKALNSVVTSSDKNDTNDIEMAQKMTNLSQNVTEENTSKILASEPIKITPLSLKMTNRDKIDKNDTKKRKEKIPLINPLKRKEKKLKVKPFLQNQGQEDPCVFTTTTQQPKKRYSKSQTPASDLPLSITEEFIISGLQVNPNFDLSSIYLDFRTSRINQNYTNNNWLNAWISYLKKRKFHKKQGEFLLMHKEQKMNSHVLPLATTSHSSALQHINTTTLEELKQRAIEFVKLKSQIQTQIDTIKQQEWSSQNLKDKHSHRQEASKLSFSLLEKQQSLESEFVKNSHLLQQGFHFQNWLFDLENELDKQHNVNG